MLIYQEASLSLTDYDTPVIVHVKQFDNKARKVRCSLTSHSEDWPVPDGIIVSCTGTRPDGAIFQYSSETAPDKVFTDNGDVIFTVTEFMTRVYGSMQVDVTMLSTDGEVLGSFTLILKVEQAAISSRKLSSLTYAGIVAAIEEGITGCFITEQPEYEKDGYFGITSDDGLGLTKDSTSSTVEKLLGEILNCTITDNGHIAFETLSELGLVFSMDDEGHVIVEYGDY